jgi:hypothetical protein
VIATSKKQRGKSGPALVPNTTKLVKKTQMSLVSALYTQVLNRLFFIQFFFFFFSFSLRASVCPSSQTVDQQNL